MVTAGSWGCSSCLELGHPQQVWQAATAHPAARSSGLVQTAHCHSLGPNAVSLAAFYLAKCLLDQHMQNTLQYTVLFAGRMHN